MNIGVGVENLHIPSTVSSHGDLDIQRSVCLAFHSQYIVKSRDLQIMIQFLPTFARELCFLLFKPNKIYSNSKEPSKKNNHIS